MSNLIRKSLELNKNDYYLKHLLIINHILPVQMTPKEAEVLAAFMALEGDISKDPFGTSGRKLVRQQVNISQGGLGNYLDQLKSKQFIYEEEDVLKIIPILIPNKMEQYYQFRLKVNET